MSRTNGDTYTKQQIEQRRDEAIRRALRTPPTPLKELKKKRKPKSGSSSSKRDDP